jgi:hypothetical protein
MQKVAMPLSAAFGHPFFLVLSEAYLLTIEGIGNKII